MSEQSTQQATGVAPKVMFHLAHIAPATVHELVESTGEKSNTVQHALMRLYESGFLVRVKRPQDKRGTNPYEYAIKHSPELVDND